MAGKVFWGIESLRSSPDVVGDPTLILVGDSWFWYPFNNLASELAAQLLGDHRLLVLGNNGAKAQEWSTKYRKQIDLAFRWYAGSCQALLLSGGGNDIAGTDDFDPIVEDNCKAFTSVAQCYSPGQPRVIMGKIEASYREVIAKFRKYNQLAPVVCHNYDKAWPTGRGVFGPADWLKAPMDHASVPNSLRRDLFEDLLMDLNACQKALAKEKATLGNILPIQTTGTLPDKKGVWANELHLQPWAYDRMVKQAWIPALNSIGVT